MLDQELQDAGEDVLDVGLAVPGAPVRREELHGAHDVDQDLAKGTEVRRRSSSVGPKSKVHERVGDPGVGA